MNKHMNQERNRLYVHGKHKLMSLAYMCVTQRHYLGLNLSFIFHIRQEDEECSEPGVWHIVHTKEIFEDK